MPPLQNNNEENQPGSFTYNEGFNDVEIPPLTPRIEPSMSIREMQMRTILELSRTDRNRNSSHYESRQRQRESHREQEERNIVDHATNATRLINEQNKTLPKELHFDCVCSICEMGLRIQETNTYQETNMGLVCGRCLSDRMKNCSLCKNVASLSEMKFVNDVMWAAAYCPHCAKKVPHCENEGCTTLIADKGENVGGKQYCVKCIHEYIRNQDKPDISSREIYHQPYSHRKMADNCSDGVGSIVKSKRIFSAEIEVNAPSCGAANKVTRAMGRTLGVTHDGSIEGEYGVEYQTPKLQGKNGEAFIMNLSKTMLKNGFTEASTNISTGMHIHLDAEDYKGDKVQSLMLFYLLFEDVVQSFLPRSRRNNEYCIPIRDRYNFSEISRISNKINFEKIWYRELTRREVDRCKTSRHETRYMGINMHSLLADQHLEVRYHSGTINARKILEWVNLHCKIMDFVVKNSLDKNTMRDIRTVTDIKEKTEILFDLIDLHSSSREYLMNRQVKFAERSRNSEQTVLVPELLVPELA